jgi:D-glycero-alpha-D-manno-heptose-7-phosphate kinase
MYACTTIEPTDDGRVEFIAPDLGKKEVYENAMEVDTDGYFILHKGVYNRIVRQFTHHPLSLRIASHVDAPVGGGLGTSSTLVVSILGAYVEWLKLPLGEYDIARLAYEIERIDLGLTGGKQDQYAAAFGGFNFIEFLTNDMAIVNPLKIKRWIIDELEASILLYFTGRSRSSAAIIDEQKRNTEEANKEAIEAMHKIKQSAVDMKLALLKGDIDTIADILRNAWENKKKMATHITNPAIQQAMETAMKAGAKAGKVSGAGGGGFIMFIVEPTRKKEVEEALSALNGFVMPFNFSDGGAHGWKIYETDKVNAF